MSQGCEDGKLNHTQKLGFFILWIAIFNALFGGCVAWAWCDRIPPLTLWLRCMLALGKLD
jgi:hypothetical protein